MKFWPFSRKPEPAPAPRKQPVLSRSGYSAAGSKLTFADFRGSKGSADYELLNDLSRVREKARALARNSGTMKRYLRLLKVNVVGSTGFRYRCRVKRTDGKLDITMNKAVELAYWNWAKKPTTCGKMNMRAVENLVVESWARDGEAFVEIVVNSRFRDGIALNPLESDMIDETLNGINQSTGNEIRMGVEIDEYAAPVAYHILMQHPGDPGWYHQKKMTGRRHRRVEASRIIHLYEKLRAGQTRGEPPASAAILGVKMLDGYREAEVTNRRVRSSAMGFFQRALPGAGQIDAIADRRMTETDEENAFEMDLQPGAFRSLPDGYEFKAFEPGGATTDYKDFEGQVKRDLSMGLGISAMSLGMETDGVSYSTGRSVLQEDREFYKCIQEFVIDDFSTVVIQNWIRMHSIQDASTIPPSKITKVIESSSLVPRGWDWVDPKSDVQANSEALKTRQTSLSRILGQRGIDVVDMIEEISDDEAMLDAAGLTVTFGNDKPVDNNANSDGGQGDGKAVQGQ